MIRQIFKCELNSADGIEWLRMANKQFGDFRNKLVNGIENLANDFKENRALLVSYLFFFFICLFLFANIYH